MDNLWSWELHKPTMKRTEKESWRTISFFNMKKALYYFQLTFGHVSTGLSHLLFAKKTQTFCVKVAEYLILNEIC